MQQNATGALGILSEDSENAATIAAAGAIPLLVRLLGAGSPAAVQQGAAGALRTLSKHTENVATIAAAGAIPLLVQLLGTGSEAGAQQSAAGVLSRIVLVEGSAPIARGVYIPSAATENVATIVAAGAVPLLVQLLRPRSGADTQLTATDALSHLARFDEFAGTIAAAGAIPPLVHLLGPGSRADVRTAATFGHLAA
ncbi:hypothetical protein FOA52_008321 [Chlamydomonas sp. UWO 241]|nr:hypothetical protein FOA52_008321 [Chlamydomonas sp. UWO 241]